MVKFIVIIATCLVSIKGLGQNVGHTSTTFIDVSRNNRSIPCEVYYPAEAAGVDVAASNPSALGLSSFPAIAVGHGFVINSGSYELIANFLVPHGFVVALVNTESGFSPNHEAFGLDLSFVTHALQQESLNSNSILYNKV